MAPLNHVQQVLGYSGQVNQVLIKVTTGFDVEEVAHQVEKILKPYVQPGSAIPGRPAQPRHAGF
jgi:ABC-type lipoprotein release transport system permease subunit